MLLWWRLLHNTVECRDYPVFGRKWTSLEFRRLGRLARRLTVFARGGFRGQPLVRQRLEFTPDHGSSLAIELVAAGADRSVIVNGWAHRPAVCQMEVDFPFRTSDHGPRR